MGSTKLWSLLLVVGIALLTLTACGGQAAPEPVEEAAEATATSVEVEEQETPPVAPEAEPGAICGIDTHMHLSGIYRSGGSWVSDFDAAAETALPIMNEVDIQMGLIMPPPQPPDHPSGYDYTAFAGVVGNNPERFAFLGGGGTLNPMIQEAISSGEVTSDLRRRFEETAEEIVRAGAAGFGEFTAEHLSFFERHPYVTAPPDHPLFLLLADVAAREGMPIDLHMEAVIQDIPLPEGLASPPNPEVLHENIEAFERLLAHNREARIVWAHASWDNTGHRTVALMRRLLESHPNLYLQLVFQRRVLGVPLENRLLDNGTLRPEWADLIRDFPDRFVLGSDEFYGIPGVTYAIPAVALDRSLRAEATWSLLDQLPPDLARQVACENAQKIYRLKE